MRRRTVGRLVAVLALVVLGALAFGPAVVASPTTPAPVAVACGPAEGCATQPSESIAAQANRDAVPCLGSADCGGGALLAGAGGVIVAVIGATLALVLPTRGRRHLGLLTQASTGRLSAGRLFRPPRLSV